jgi:hypothetical protein
VVALLDLRDGLVELVLGEDAGLAHREEVFFLLADPRLLLDGRVVERERAARRPELRCSA